MSAQIFTGATVFDGVRLHPGATLRVREGRVVGRGPGEEVRLDGGILAPGFLDLQVNGAAGWMVDGGCSADLLAEMCAVHARLGATGILPTLITDTSEATERVIAAGVEAARRKVPGFLGLHLEGPHLDPRRKGAHDPLLIRQMDEADMVRLLEASAKLPSLMVTLAPESASPEQIGHLAAAGVIVSLGHSDCGYSEAVQAIAAGAVCVTHLFNAMSQLGNRDPGLVGAALTGPVHAGLIADGIHVAPETIRVAMASSDRLFLVSDAMAAAGSDLAEFTLNNRRILRRDGSLRLEDGTLAGADLTLPQAVRVMVGLGTPVAIALAMATSRPADCLRRGADLGHLQPGRVADLVHLRADFSLGGVWREGRRVS